MPPPRPEPLLRRHTGLVVLLVLGAALRLWAMLAYRPAVLGYPDGIEYLTNGVSDLWRGIGRPVGYPVLIRVITWFSGGLTALVTVQHLIGMATAVVLYWIVRSAGAPRGFACVPAAVVLLSGDQIYMEHSPLSEPLFGFLLALAVAFALRAASSPRRALAWCAAVGLTAGAASVVRYVGEALIPLFALWILLFLPRARVGSAAVVCVAAIAAVGGYVGARAIGLQSSGGTHGQTGLAVPGSALYGRVAPFADCSRFTPPAGTSGLCDPVKDRQEGPGWYVFFPDTPLRHAPPSAAALSDRWARAALLHQPGSYVAAVARDAARYVAPTLLRPAGEGWGDTASAYRFGRPRAEEARAVQVASGLFGPTTVERSGVGALDRYQAIVRVHGALLGLFLALALAGLVLAPRRRRAAATGEPVAAAGPAAASGAPTRPSLRGAILLPLAIAAAALVVPVAVAVYDARYAFPVEGLLATAGALGAWAVAGRRL